MEVPMKRFIALFCLFALCAALFCGCDSKEPSGDLSDKLRPEVTAAPEPDPTPMPESQTAQPPQVEMEPKPEPAEPSAPAETTPKPAGNEETRPPQTEAPAAPGSYTVSLKASVPVYSGPDRESAFVQNVGEDGVYTIVEEALSPDGALWGKLKSGLGWVELESGTAPVTPDSELPYTVSLNALDPVYSGPGYDYSYVQAVGEKGTYTIVEEAMDWEDNLWGRLKSGIGWVDLSSGGVYCPITVTYADEALLSGGCHECITDSSDYAARLLIHAHEDLKDLSLCALVLNPDGSYERSEVFYELDSLTADKPLLAAVVFYGDMSAFGLSFTDSCEILRHYALTLSGRNGEPVWTEIFL